MERSTEERPRERDPIDKAFEVLRWMVDSPATSWGVREIARGLDRPPSTIHRALVSLEAQTLVVGDRESGRYELGLEMYRLGSKAANRFSVQDLIRPHLRELQEAYDETAFLAVYEPQRLEMMMSATVESTKSLRYVVTLNEWGPLYRGASGLAILAHIPEESFDAVLDRLDRPSSDGAYVPSKIEVEDAVLKIREDGVSLTVGQRVPDAVGVAAPLIDSTGGVIGSIGLTMPSSRYSSDAGVEKTVSEVARQISADLI